MDGDPRPEEHSFKLTILTYKYILWNVLLFRSWPLETSVSGHNSRQNFQTPSSYLGAAHYEHPVLCKQRPALPADGGKGADRSDVDTVIFYTKTNPMLLNTQEIIKNEPNDTENKRDICTPTQGY